MERAIRKRNTRIRDGFEFMSFLIPFNEYNALLIEEGRGHSIEEFVQFVNEHRVEQAYIVMDNLDFLRECPTLKYIVFVPAAGSTGPIDLSPLYEHPEIKYLNCYNDIDDDGNTLPNVTPLDYLKINGLEYVQLRQDDAAINQHQISTLKTLLYGGYKNKERNLKGMFCSKDLDTLKLVLCEEKSLDGIEVSEKLQALFLAYNRSLRDISALLKVKKTLRALRIYNCPKIEDLSILGELENLEHLLIQGSNVVPNLDFIRKMKNLKTFLFNIPVKDGDLSPCLDLSYVYCWRARRYYNLKDKDLPKKEYYRGLEGIEMWRQITH